MKKKHKVLQVVDDFNEIRQSAQCNNFGGGATVVPNILKLSQSKKLIVFGLF